LIGVINIEPHATSVKSTCVDPLLLFSFIRAL
jgi:hypothetical protein